MHENTCTKMFITLFVKAPKWKECKSPPTVEIVAYSYNETWNSNGTQ